MRVVRGWIVRQKIAGRKRRARQAGEEMSPSEIADLLRVAADDQLTEQQAQSLHAHLAAHPEDHEFIAFERRLRAAVGRVMGQPAAPADLRARIEAELYAPPHRFAGAAAPLSRPFTTRRPRRLFVPSGLAAGFLLLVGVAVGIGVVSHSDWFDWFRPAQIPISDEGGSLGFPVQEHELCAKDDLYARRKFTLHSEAELHAHLSNDLHWDVSVPDLSPFGFALRDAGDCDAGGGSADSIHMRYTNDSTTVSVWIEHSLPSELTHSAGLEEGHAYYVTPTNRQLVQDESIAYYAWRVGEFVYRIVPASVTDSHAMAVSIGMPDVALEEFH